MELPAEVKSAIDDKVFGHLGTVMADGSPQVSVVWIDREGDRILFSTAEGRVKADNIVRDNRVALSITPVSDDYTNYVMKGRVTKIETDGWWLIDALARKYTNADEFLPKKPGQVRVNCEITIDSVASND